MGRTHIATGWLVGCGLVTAVDRHDYVLRIGVGVLNSCVVLAPDWDAEGSMISRSLPPLTTVMSWIIRHLSRGAYLITRTPKDRRSKGTHRYLTHTLAWALFCGALVGSLVCVYWQPASMSALLGGVVFLGNLTHCLGDDVTESGIPLWWPLKIKNQRWYRVHLMPKKLRLTTGTEAEADLFKWVFVPAGVLVFPGAWTVVSDLAAALFDVASPLWIPVQHGVGNVLSFL